MQVCENCEEKELVKIETEQGNFWACSNVKKSERGKGCGIMITEEEYLERKDSLLSAKQAAQKRQDEEKAKQALQKREDEGKAEVLKKAGAFGSAPPRITAPGILAHPSEAIQKAQPECSPAVLPIVSELTEEQKARIAKNKQEALARKAITEQRAKEQNQGKLGSSSSLTEHAEGLFENVGQQGQVKTKYVAPQSRRHCSGRQN